MEGYAAADFLALFGCALAVGFGVAFLAAFAFPLAVDSCLTVAVIAAMVTLYNSEALRRTYGALLHEAVIFCKILV
jgi:hypothetical protein